MWLWPRIPFVYLTGIYILVALRNPCMACKNYIFVIFQNEHLRTTYNSKTVG